MTGFETFIKGLLNQRGINEQDKKDLQFEIEDHLLLLKKEYLDEGLSEQDAIKLSIKDFGDSNVIGNNIKNNLPSGNKATELSISEKISCLLEMFLVYFIFKYLWDAFAHADYSSIFLCFAMAIPVTFTSFIFINKRLRDEKNKVKNIILCNTLFFILEKIIMCGFIMCRAIIVDRNISLIYLINWFKRYYAFDWKYIVVFLLATVCSIILTKLLKNELLINIKNNYNYTAKSIVIFIIAILLTIIYSLILHSETYRLDLLENRIVNITGLQISSMSLNMNPLFMILNDKFIIPNIGLIILAIIFIRLAIKSRRTRAKSAS